MTAYDRETHALIKNMSIAPAARRTAPRCRRTPMARSICISVPRRPRARKSNWVPTDPVREFELMFRLYAPTKALFDKAWKLPDVEKVK